MSPRVRPATTLCVILTIAFAFQLIAILSVPVTNSIYLSSYQGYKFGVFGLCFEMTCSSIGIGYSSNTIEDLKGFSLPSNARHSVSKLLIVHPISAGFTLVLLLGSFLLHWHGPSSSLRFLFFLLLWTMPTFLISLLSFLVDILLFIPHLSWVGWTILASTVLTAISGVLFSIMRRTVSSRKSAKRLKKSSTFNEYQMGPLNYGIGIVDGGSVSKVTTDDGDNDQAKPFADGIGTSFTFDNSFQHTNNENLNNYPQTELYNTMGSDDNSNNNNGQQSRYTESLLDSFQPSYRGYSDYNTNDKTDPYRSTKVNTPSVFMNPMSPYGQDALESPSAPGITPSLLERTQELTRTTSTAPYPINIPQAELTDLPVQKQQPQTPYLTSDYTSSSTNILPASPSKPLGPRPMLNSTTDVTSLDPSNMPYPKNLYKEDKEEQENLEFGFNSLVNDSNPSLAIAEPEIGRNPTYRTAIENKLNKLQSMAISNSLDSLNNLTNKSSTRQQRQIGLLNESDFESTYEDASTTDFDTTLDKASKIHTAYPNSESNVLPSTTHTISTPINNNTTAFDSNYSVLEGDGSLYAVPKTHITNGQPEELSYNNIYKQSQPEVQDVHLLAETMHKLNDNASSAYSSKIPSVAATTITDQFSRDTHRKFDNFPENLIADGTTPSEYSTMKYSLPDPMDRRTTPTPSFSNESILSSTFTSVSQREVNPKYLEKHDPAKHKSFLQRQILLQTQTAGIVSQPQQQSLVNRKSMQMPSASEILISSNPDFTVETKNKRMR